jgi:hypothetical protein
VKENISRLAKRNITGQLSAHFFLVACGSCISVRCCFFVSNPSSLPLFFMFFHDSLCFVFCLQDKVYCPLLHTLYMQSGAAVHKGKSIWLRIAEQAMSVSFPLVLTGFTMYPSYVYFELSVDGRRWPIKRRLRTHCTHEKLTVSRMLGGTIYSIHSNHHQRYMQCVCCWTKEDDSAAAAAAAEEKNLLQASSLHLNSSIWVRETTLNFSPFYIRNSDPRTSTKRKPVLPKLMPSQQNLVFPPYKSRTV